MTTDTSREAVQDLIAEAQVITGNPFPPMSNRDATLTGRMQDTLAALLDERDEALRSNKNLRRISNANGDWSEKYQAALRRAECAEAGYETMLESLNRVESENAALTAKLDAVKAYDEELFRVVDRFTSGQETMFPLIEAVERWRHADRAILADTDEPKGN